MTSVSFAICHETKIAGCTSSCGNIVTSTNFCCPGQRQVLFFVKTHFHETNNYPARNRREIYDGQLEIRHSQQLGAKRYTSHT